MPKILVVDDDIQTLRLVGLVLDREGYEIIAARDGRQALDKIRAEKPDLVVLDIMMPKMDGYKVARRLRADPQTADLPILMFTARDAVEDKVKGFEAGADDFLTKPVHPEELVSRVQALLRRFLREQPKEEPPRAAILGFLGSKGGVGTTTLAVNAAVVLASGALGPDGDDQRVILAETRHGMGTASAQLGLPHRDGLGSVLAKPVGQIEPQFVEARLDEHSCGLLVLGGRTQPLGTGKSVSPDHAEAVVHQLGALADYLLLDMGVGLDETNRRLLPLCTHIVVVMEPDDVSLILANDLLAELSQSLSIPRHRISLVVIKRSRSASTLDKSEIEERLEHRIIAMIPPAPELAFQSARQQLPMVMADLDSLVVRQLRRFVEDLVEAA